MPPPDLGMGAIALEFNLVVGWGRAGRGRLLPPPSSCGALWVQDQLLDLPHPKKKKTPGCPWGQAPPLLPKEGTRCSQPVSRLQSIVEGKKKQKKKTKKLLVLKIRAWARPARHPVPPPRQDAAPRGAG